MLLGQGNNAIVLCLFLLTMEADFEILRVVFLIGVNETFQRAPKPKELLAIPVFAAQAADLKDRSVSLASHRRLEMDTPPPFPP